MSNYGPPGGPYPGPQEPWPGPGPHDPYGESAQRWGGRHSWGEPQPHGRHGDPEPGYLPYPQPGYPDDRGGYRPVQRDEPAYPPTVPDPAWSDPPLPPGRDQHGSRRPILILVVLGLLVLGGSGAAIYLLGRGEQPTTPGASPRASAAAASQPAGPTVPATATPASHPSPDARFVKVGQCVKNEGVASTPKLVITKCGSRTYQVLARINGPTTGERDAKAKCGKVAGYTDWYFFNSELDALDFVLCLKLR